MNRAVFFHAGRRSAFPPNKDRESPRRRVSVPGRYPLSF